MIANPQPSPWKAARLTLSTEGQTKESLTELLYAVLGRGGCYACGRMTVLEVAFEGDPGPDMGDLGVVSVEAE